MDLKTSTNITNLHIYPSFFTNESRILREAKAIVELGCVDQVILVGLWKQGLACEERLSEQITIKRIKTRITKQKDSQLLNLLIFALFFVKVVQLARKTKPSIVNLHSLTVLPLGVLIKWLVKSQIIYDAHELETETQASKGLRRFFAKAIERFCIRYADRVIVVSESISKWYVDRYKLKNIVTVRNIPVVKNEAASNKLRDLLGVNSSAIVFIYVGLFTKGRGIQIILDAFAKINDPNKHLVFLGFGELESKIKMSTSANIHLLPAVAPEHVAEFITSADVGLSIIENTCLSYYYSLPNKVFEYMAGGIPFISSDFPDVRLEFEGYNVCWLAESPSDLSLLLLKLTRDDITARKNNVLLHRNKWNWTEEKLKLIPVYKELI